MHSPKPAQPHLGTTSTNKIAPTSHKLAIMPPMGFTTFISLGATLASTAIKTSSAMAQSKAYKNMADHQQESGEEQKELLIDTALANNTRAKKNMQNELAGARLDAAKSNLAPSGSAYMREVSMATRLQDEITHTTDRSLQDANLVYEQALFDSQSTRMQSQAAKTNAWSSLFSGLGSMANTINNSQKG